MATFVISRPYAALFAVLAILVPVALARALAGAPQTEGAKPAARRRRGFGGLVIGKDGRASTSKLQAVLWTFAVFFALVFMLFWGRSLGCGEASRSNQTVCQSAAKARSSFEDFLNHGLQPEYFILLGFPLGAAVAAKAITSAQVKDHPNSKPEIAEDSSGIAQSLRDVVSNDDGETDLLDFQYFAFNLLTLAFFFSQFLTHPAGGLPDLPPTLIALSGLSASTYVTKKALFAADLTSPARKG
jgi:hypothetical protein